MANTLRVRLHSEDVVNADLWQAATVIEAVEAFQAAEQAMVKWRVIPKHKRRDGDRRLYEQAEMALEAAKARLLEVNLG